MSNSLIFSGGRKFMWDGVEYPSRERASEKMKKYKEDHFEVEAVERNGKILLYTRRVIKEVVVQNV